MKNTLTVNKYKVRVDDKNKQEPTQIITVYAETKDEAGYDAINAYLELSPQADPEVVYTQLVALGGTIEY